MKIRNIALVITVFCIFSIPQMVSAATFHAETLNPYPTIFTTLEADGGSGDGNVDCIGLANWGIYTGWAAIYRIIYPDYNEQIEVGISWSLAGRLISGFSVGASWDVYYFWCTPDYLWSGPYGSDHLEPIAHDENTGWFGEDKITEASESYTNRYVLDGKVLTSGPVYFGLKIKFFFNAPIPGVTEIKGINPGTAFHLDVTRMAWGYA